MGRFLINSMFGPYRSDLHSSCNNAVVAVIVIIVTTVQTSLALAADPDAPTNFRKTVEPVLNDYCMSCHNSTLKKGGVVFDPDDVTPLLQDKDLWLKAIKMLRAKMMPPKGKDRPSAEEVAQVERWIKYSALGIDPQNPDPGHVTLHRLNRTEYRNTIRDLMGVDFNTTAEFPADDTGHGFDNISDVLTISPLLMEKYIAAAKSIITQAVPTQPLVPAEKRITGQEFTAGDSKPAGRPGGPLKLSYYKPTTATYTLQAEHAGRYVLVLDLTANESYVEGQFDANKCKLVFKSSDKVLLTQEFSRQGGKPYRFEFEQDWVAGKQDLTLEIQPLTPNEK
ncbi:MAG TPA: DUF1587 domain-containing protein, partial [Gemmataceae bacterium]|nr:DUF1587 domain-containing protein [Gemmataceae bacterium]